MNHNDFIDYHRMDRLVRISQDFLNESPVAFVTYGGIATGPKSIPSVRMLCDHLNESKHVSIVRNILIVHSFYQVLGTIASGVLLTLQFQT